MSIFGKMKSRFSRGFKKLGGAIIRSGKKALQFVEKKALPVGEKLTGKLGNDILTGLEFVAPEFIPELEAGKQGLNVAHGFVKKAQVSIDKGHEIERKIHPFL